MDIQLWHQLGYSDDKVPNAAKQMSKINDQLLNAIDIRNPTLLGQQNNTRILQKLGIT